MFDNTNILQESVEQNRIIDAIKKRYEVRVSYKSDDEPKGSGERIIQPVAYGLSKSGNPVVRAFQPFGDTKTKVPHWKLFRLDRFEEWKPLKNRKFKEPPQSPFNTEGKFNPYGDKSMSEVYIVADFKGSAERYERGGLKKYNDSVRAQKTNDNPYYGLKKNIEKSVMATPEIMKRIGEWHKNKPKQMVDYLNNQNTEEMKMSQNFGDKNITQTTGPITKDNQIDSNKTEPIKDTEYNKIMTNGPVTTTKEKLKQKDEFETVDNVNLNDNNQTEEEVKDNKQIYGK